MYNTQITVLPVGSMTIPLMTVSLVPLVSINRKRPRRVALNVQTGSLQQNQGLQMQVTAKVYFHPGFSESSIYISYHYFSFI